MMMRDLRAELTPTGRIKMKLGFIGLGIMGTPMAGHLIAAGHEVYLATKREIPAALLNAGGTGCQNAQEVAEKSDIVFLMVPDTPQVEDVLFGENGVMGGISSGKLVVDQAVRRAGIRDRCGVC